MHEACGGGDEPPAPSAKNEHDVALDRLGGGDGMAIAQQPFVAAHQHQHGRDWRAMHSVAMLDMSWRSVNPGAALRGCGFQCFGAGPAQPPEAFLFGWRELPPQAGDLVGQVEGAGVRPVRCPAFAPRHPSQVLARLPPGMDDQAITLGLQLFFRHQACRFDVRHNQELVVGGQDDLGFALIPGEEDGTVPAAGGPGEVVQAGKDEGVEFVLGSNRRSRLSFSANSMGSGPNGSRDIFTLRDGQPGGVGLRPVRLLHRTRHPKVTATLDTRPPRRMSKRPWPAVPQVSPQAFS